MKETKIYDEKINGFHSIKEIGDFEYANPIEKIIEIVRSISIINDKNYFSLLKENKFDSLFVGKNRDLSEELIERNALQTWKIYLQQLFTQKLQENLFQILKTDSKKEQIKILKSASLSIDSLNLFIIKAYEDHNFSFSQYLSKHNPKNISDYEMPRFSKIENNGDVKIIGSTKLSNGQIKAAIEQRHVVLIKFLDNGEKWHCFFHTYKSIQGLETGEYPHLHYISHLWGLSRQKVLSELQSKHYKLPSTVHVKFIN